jgi:small subunit ribosomal protein S19
MRSVWKGPYITQNIYKNLLQNNKKFFFIKKKNIVILPEFVGLTVKIYNGQKFFDIKILASMVGHKFGEFVFTRKIHVFKTKR